MNEALGFEFNEAVESLVGRKAQRLNNSAVYCIGQRRSMFLNCFPVTINFYLRHIRQCC